MRENMPLRREVRTPQPRPVPPLGALIALAAVAMLMMWAWFGAVVSSQATRSCPYRSAPAPAPPVIDAPPAAMDAPPAPAGAEPAADCAFSELLDCSYGGVER